MGLLEGKLNRNVSSKGPEVVLAGAYPPPGEAEIEKATRDAEKAEKEFHEAKASGDPQRTANAAHKWFVTLLFLALVLAAANI